MSKKTLPDREKLLAMSEEELSTLISYHNSLYWEKSEPEITDEDYDSLLRRLGELNPEHPLVLAVHAPLVASSGKVRHSSPMLSLNKAYSLAELLAWARKCARSEDEEFLIQPKYDGISANFSAGVLASRGDGGEGENISDKLPLIELESVDYRGPVNRPVRGEIVIRSDDFKNIYPNIKKNDGKPYKNSRNAVAGIMGLKEIASMRAQGAKLTLVDYELVSYKVKLSDFEARWPAIVQEIETLPYPLDGIVVKLADLAYSESLGSTSHHPRGQMAFKFSGIRKQTKLLSVEWSFGKNCLTPVAELEPVDIGGITIRHATLHNAQNIVDKNIHIGDTVTVERAGDVIPYIISAESSPESQKELCLISFCPSCNCALAKDGPELRCTNSDCPETKVQRLLAAVRNIGIERLGEPNIRKMMNFLGVKSLKDIFNLSRDNILSLDGFKDKSADNLLKEIASARKVPDYQLIAALNIQGIGPAIAKKILSVYTLAELRSLSADRLSELEGIGPERAAILESELRAQSSILDELIACIELIQTKGTGGDGSQKICFTGKMPQERSYYEDIARKHGFEPVDSVTKNLSILVAVDISGSSSKLQNARKLGVSVLSLDEWLASLERPASPPARPIPPPAKNNLPPDDLFSQNWN
ncbi:MAG: hypothetical protein A2X49_10015 [Lentisphaerae bacterium GWF2_52_8]|nr:MAG: hypothetical protein A2X49_10015 [Lentisphaerae bacterium GWF2_52_8]